MASTVTTPSTAPTGSALNAMDFSLKGLTDKFSKAVGSASGTATNFLSGLGSKSTVNSRGFNTRSYFGTSAPSSSTLFGNPTSFLSSTGSLGVAAGSMGYFSRIGTYIGSVLIVLLILLIFVHYFITPIFQLRPGGPGVIPIPGIDDGVLYWDTTAADTIEEEKDSRFPIREKYSNYTMNMDIFINSSFDYSDRYRFIFGRGATLKTASASSADTIMGLLSAFNVAVVLLPGTNDLQVSVLTDANTSEDIVIHNIPIQETFRLGIVVMDHALEVYLNGKLVKTKTHTNNLKAITGDIKIALGTAPPIAKIKNLKIWPRILATSEIRHAKPAMVQDSSASIVNLSGGNC
jgi:hypothetical protein